MVEQIEAAWQHGSSSDPEPSDHAVATSALRRAELRLKGSEARARRAERAIRSTDLDLANGVAPILSGYLPGVAVVLTHAHVPADVTPRPSELPVIVLRQSKETVREAGFLTGEVELHYLASASHREFDFEDFKKFAPKRFAYLKYAGTPNPIPGQSQEAVRVRVESVEDPHPVIVELPKRLDGGVGRVLESFLDVGDPVTQHPAQFAWSSRIGWAMLGASRHVEQIEPDTSERTLAVRTRVLLDVADHVSGHAAALLTEQAESLIGRTVPGLGRVTSATVPTIAERDSLSTDAIMAEFSEIPSWSRGRRHGGNLRQFDVDLTYTSQAC